MTSKSFYGLQIKKIPYSFYKKKLYDNEYKYYIIKLKKNQTLVIKNINVGSLVCIKNMKNSRILLNGDIFNLNKHKYFEFSKKKIIIKILEGNLQFILAGIKKKIYKNYLKYFEEKELYKVIKPWGNEIWINGQKPTYSIKKISIKKGYRTSLQFHKKKFETNFLQKGKAKLYYSTKSGKYSKNIILNNLRSINIKSNESISVKKLAIHRIEAINNLTLFEVSTPHLDDVVRISDDKNRKSGRVISEHKKVNK